jgi:hypothetical protein
MKKSIASIFIILLIISCHHDTLKVDVSDVVVPELTINRLEQDVFNMDTTHLLLSANKLKTKYGRFYNSYVMGILNNGGSHDTSKADLLKLFISDKDMRDAYSNCQKIYPDVNNLKEEFTQSFKYFKNYFPNRPIPKVITMMSGFNYSIVTQDSTLAIGLEMYLGSDNKFYPALGMPRYKSMFMNKENILPDALRAWMINEFPYMMNKNDFLSEVISMGK